jgi:hypothetical protein
MKSSFLITNLANQFNSSWNLIHQAVERCTDENWSQVLESWSFSWTLYHVVETLDFYLRETPKGMQWGKRAGISWDTQSKDEIKSQKSQISKDFMKQYISDIETKANQLVHSMDEKEILIQDEFDWFETRLEKYIYALRHTMFHIGECNKTLRDKKAKRIKWQ